jgi:hypothetical protein
MTSEVSVNSPVVPANPAGQVPANAGNATVSQQKSFTQVLEVANSPATSPTIRTSAAARKEAEYWANFAESVLAMMGEAMVNHNRHLDLMKNHWAIIARINGPEMAARLKAEDTTLSRHEKIIRGGELALQRNFYVEDDSGRATKIAIKDAEGYYHFGEFILSRMGEGFSLKIDSRSGAGVVYGKNAAVSVSTLESAFLPWNMDDEDER